ncbi:16S rRNA (adenine(1518)-N(6)/adenine(1519)-N(6))-dimethyltransferase RsmA [Truepera radiovictrix]|uniref:Ribosomal RNA small subunit methyltransferase A n=1 Tax=Truepera radiovictrix (strain DSM 17093 / CIP 108686 / LMG 22925 / RQ-24) TaxID=649638 RepID=D7CTV5_TRURR|nr:16S rRNA (adenine(1518)-N(6)/adenine(1519)-N(6))-dimethyltransferase RsmA [Truepera radiovictrix]ADI15652.1 dimethyladenosine transferase [Truepera radiovictrix DSM 17093]WMT58720.1 16S rRNA (adenine(1518)-N(6)/adenine(1519)-N(6))-dimethyltransferase RsmA [Truepera radiovictrix]
MRELLERHGLRADKGFGQNFLVDEGVLRSIVAAAELGPQSTVLEVGPGLGVLTRELAARAGRVISVELDRRLLPVLQETLAGLGNVTLVHGDGLTFDLSCLPEGSAMVANLPYNVGTPILVRALESGRFARVVVLLQREVAERLSATPGTPAYGALSVVVAHFGRARSVRLVKPSAFSPPPEVTSSVVRLDLTPGRAPDPALFRLVRHAFAHRRKTLKKNLLMAGYPAERVARALQTLGLEAQVRAERLSVEQFRALRQELEGG